MLLTNDEFVALFSHEASKWDKVYVPDVVDNVIANNVIIFFDNHKEDRTLLEKCVQAYCKKNKKIVVTIKEFANNLDEYYYGAIEERESQEKFQALLKQTEKRMNQFESRD